MTCLRLLFVEDSPADVRLLREAFAESSVDDVEVVHCADGEAALAYLRSGRDGVDAILLDLKMPRLDGREFLRELRRDASLAELPVTVLTSSHYEGDLEECRALAVRGYVLKPADFDAMVAVAERVVQMCREAKL